MATAAVLVPATLAVVYWAPAALFALAVFLLAWLAQREFFALARAGGQVAYERMGLVGAALMVAAAGLRHWPAELNASLLWVGLGLALLIRPLFSRGQFAGALAAAAVTMFGIFYPAWLLALLAAVHRRPGGVAAIFLLLVVVWCGDTAAYYAGRAWGRHRMAPRVSPKKSWEGAVASAAASVGAAILFARYAWPALDSAQALGVATGGGAAARLTWGAAAWLGLALNIAAQVGDLAESALKRGVGVKDSGTLLPGHGGILDRIDALLFAIPVLWYYVTLRF